MPTTWLSRNTSDTTYEFNHRHYRSVECTYRTYGGQIYTTAVYMFIYICGIYHTVTYTRPTCPCAVYI